MTVESDHPLGIFHGNEETAGGRSIYGKWSARKWRKKLIDCAMMH